MSMKNKKIRHHDGFSASKNLKRRSLLPKEEERFLRALPLHLYLL